MLDLWWRRIDLGLKILLQISLNRPRNTLMIIETYSEILKKKNGPGSFLEDQTSPQTAVYGGEESLKRGEESASLN